MEEREMSAVSSYVNETKEIKKGEILPKEL